MFRSILGSDKVNSGKNTEINKQSHFKFWFNRKNMEFSYFFGCIDLSLAVNKKCAVKKGFAYSLHCAFCNTS